MPTRPYYVVPMSNMNRRDFFGMAALGGAGLLLPESAVRAAMPSVVSATLLEKARAALATHSARIMHKDVVAIVDFSAPSSAQRLHLLNMDSGRTTSLLVAHGRGSDPAHTGWVQRFSNVPGSAASANGSYLTSETYMGHHGLSRRLIGLDPINDQAENRAIVIHAAWYVNHAAAQTLGMIGRSEGCFAVSSADVDLVLNQLGPGRLLFADKA